MDEFRLIARMIEILGSATGRDPRIEVGPGDDAAVVRVSQGRVVATTDSLVQDTHFRWNWCRPEDVGYKAVVVNLSDLVAMGAEPVGLLASLCLPKDMRDAWVLRVVRGMAEACRDYRVGVVGGNVAATNGPFEVTITALGEPRGGRVLTRCGARAGDGVFLSGPVGGAALGLAVLDKAPRSAWRVPGLVGAWRRPRPRTDLVPALTEMDGIHAVIDISDGLLQDLGHILTTSGVGANIETRLIPLCSEAETGGRLLKMDPLHAALTGGEDYEVVVCASSKVNDDLIGLGFTRIGEVVNRTRPRIRLSQDGRPSAVSSRAGYRHR